MSAHNCWANQRLTDGRFWQKLPATHRSGNGLNWVASGQAGIGTTGKQAAAYAIAKAADRRAQSPKLDATSERTVSRAMRPQPISVAEAKPVQSP